MECYTSYDAMTAELPMQLHAEQEPEENHLGDNEVIGAGEDIGEEEESSLAFEYSDDATKLYLQEIRRTKLLTAEEERDLAVRIERGDRTAREKMIVANLRLVVSICKRYMNRGLPFSDLIEEGNLGLMKAVDRFKVSKECRFSTYATWWIRQSVERALVNQSRTVRLPVHVAEALSRVNRVSSTLRGQMKREPTLEEVADSLGVEEAQVRKLLAHTKRTDSLDRPCGEDKDAFLVDLVEDTSATSPATLMEGVDSYQLITTLIENLPKAEKTILTLRFGLEDHEPRTLDEIGRSFGVTRERIRQIEAKTLQKLRGLVESSQPAAARC